MKNFKVSPLVCQFGSTFGFFRYRRRKYLEVLLLFLSLRYVADLGRSRLVFSSDYNPHTDRSTFLTILTILKYYDSYLANLKYWCKSSRSSIFTSSKKLKRTKKYASLEYFQLCETFFSKIFLRSQKGPPFEFSHILQLNLCQSIPKGPPSTLFGTMRVFFKEFFSKIQSFFPKKTFCAF